MGCFGLVHVGFGWGPPLSVCRPARRTARGAFVLGTATDKPQTRLLRPLKRVVAKAGLWLM